MPGWLWDLLGADQPPDPSDFMNPFGPVGSIGSKCVKKGGKYVFEKVVKLEKHHLLPKQFVEKSEKAGLNIQHYLMEMPKARHRLKPHGLHTGSDNWNKQWKHFFEKCPNPTKEQILGQLDKII